MNNATFRFNGATTIQLWKQGLSLDVALFIVHASMEPQQFSCGNFIDSGGFTFRKAGLQWSHNNSVVETELGGYVPAPVVALQWSHNNSVVETQEIKNKSGMNWALQWSHNNSVVETGDALDYSGNGNHGFNGATTIQLWKHNYTCFECITILGSFNGATTIQLWKHTA